MIRTITDSETMLIWQGERSRRLPPDIQQTARRKLRQLHAVKLLDELRIPRGNRLEQLKSFTPLRCSIRINDQRRMTFRWLMETRTMSGSRIITDGGDEQLPNVHPGDILREDFLIGSQIPLGEVAEGARLDENTLADLLASRRPVDAALDARLTRYFGMSDGFFLRLQNSYDMEEVARGDAETLARIVPRAA